MFKIDFVSDDHPLSAPLRRHDHLHPGHQRRPAQKRRQVHRGKLTRFDK